MKPKLQYSAILIYMLSWLFLSACSNPTRNVSIAKSEMPQSYQTEPSSQEPLAAQEPLIATYSTEKKCQIKLLYTTKGIYYGHFDINAQIEELRKDFDIVVFRGIYHKEFLRGAQLILCPK